MAKNKRHLKSSQTYLLIIAAFAVVVVAVILLTESPKKEAAGHWVKDSRGVWVAEGIVMDKPEYVRNQEFIINEAALAYRVVKDRKEDLSSGPCLGVVFADWVADLVHSPRQATDDVQENECPAYLSGAARHFIELSLNGDVVRVQ